MADKIEAAVRLAQKQWPGIQLDEARFRVHVLSHAQTDPSARLKLVDLYLALALATGDETALAVFEADYIGRLAQILGSLDTSGALKDEVAQELRIRLLTSRGERRARILDYAGRADLFSWFRVSATRTAIDLQRRSGREVAVAAEDLIAMRGVGSDPVISHMKDLYGSEVKKAIRVALGRLAPRVRTLLRLHIFEDMSIDQLGQLHRVHRTTAARWLRDGREQLAALTRNAVQEQLQLDEDELESLLRLVRSQLEITLRGFLEPDWVDAD